MAELKTIGEYYDDWRDHFESLESIAAMTDINVLIVGSNSEKRETFPVEALGHLPELVAIYLRNFIVEFGTFGGHISSHANVVDLSQVHLKGNWAGHWIGCTELSRLEITNSTIDECGQTVTASKGNILKDFWRLQVSDSSVPSELFDHFAAVGENLDTLVVNSSPGFTLKSLTKILQRGKLTSVMLDGLDVTPEWLIELSKCDSLEDISLKKNPKISLQKLLQLAELPKTTLKFLHFDYSQERRQAVDEFIAKWREIKRTKVGIEDESSPHPSVLPR